MTEQPSEDRRPEADPPLLDCRAQLGVLTAIGEALRRSRDENVVLNTALARLGQYLGASRSLYVSFSDSVWSVRHEYLDRGQSMLGAHDVNEQGLMLIGEMIGAESTVVVNDCDLLPSQQAARWKELEIRSVVFCPLLIAGVGRAAIVVHDDRPRAWTERELLLVEEVVSRCWVFLEQVKSKERLVETESLLRIASRLAKVGGWVVEVPGLQVRWAGETEAFFGYQPEFANVGSFARLIPEEFQGPLSVALQRCIEHGEPYDVQFPIMLPEVGRVWIRCVAEAERGPDGSVTRILGAYQNMEDQHRLEEQWRRTQKLEAVGHLAGGIAHDFNNVLSVILGYTSLILDSDDISETLREDVQEIHQAGQKANLLTSQLLAFSRRKMAEVTAINLGELINGMKTLLSRLVGETVSVSLSLAEDLQMVMADWGQIEQMVMNLAVNARDAMEAGGQLTIGTRAEKVETPPPDCSQLAPGEYAVLYVQDTGKGIDEETKARMFEPFFTTKEAGKGTGLGLSTVKGIVKQSQGHIRVTSQPGQGARFEIYLPVATYLSDPVS